MSSPRLGQRSRCPRAGDFQAALTQAQRGDEIVLEAGATYTGSFTLPAKPGTGWIVIRSSAMASLPPAGQRVRPADAVHMPKLVTPNVEPALKTAAQASHYRIMGVEITAAGSQTLNYWLVGLGGDPSIQTTLAQVPSHLILDRVYIHGHPQLDVRRCVALNSAASAVIDSYLAECHHSAADAQAIGGWNGPGPFKIVNNYLEGSGENVAFFGDPGIPNLVPSDIEIRHNHFFKPMAWQASGAWLVKNLFELKTGQRILVEGNVFENNWVDGQNGFAILFQPLTDGNVSPWITVRDITFRYNILRNSPGGVSLLARVAYPSAGRPALLPDEPAMRVSFLHNIFDRIGVNPGVLGTNGRLLQLLGDHQHIVYEHNTGFATSTALMFYGSGKVGTVYRNNVIASGTYGVIGNGTGEGLPTIETYESGMIYERNVLHGLAHPGLYPQNNYYPATVSDVGFVNVGGGNYRLGAASPFQLLATDGTDPGADIAMVEAATAGVVQ